MPGQTRWSTGLVAVYSTDIKKRHLSFSLPANKAFVEDELWHHRRR